MRIAGASAVLAVTAGCTPKHDTTPTTRPPTPTGLTSATGGARSPTAASAQSATAQATDLDALRRSLGDRLITPTDPTYSTVAGLFDPRFDRIHPLAIARCTSTQDIQRCLDFARSTGTPVAARSGGHSYGGYSTSSGLVIDIGPLNAIVVDTSSGIARIGAGARLADVYAKLDAAGVSIPAGSCPTVGIAGLALGGGIGVVARKYGLTCDRIKAVELVTADGQALRCDAKSEPDLLWAHRGGGGGNFGIVTALEFETYQTSPLSYFVLRWDWASAAAVIAAWQDWLPVAPDELWTSLHVDGAGSSSDTAHVFVSGVYVGDPAGLEPLINELQVASKAPLTTRFVKQAGHLQTMMIEGGCADLSVAQCRPQSEGGQLARESQLARSDYIAAPLSSSGIDVVLTAIEGRRAKKLFGGGVLFDAYGGAINRIGATDTAFAHRDKLACLQYVAPLLTVAGAGANRAWLDELYTAMRPYVSGYAYQNYIDPQLSDWQHAYYGANLNRLVGVKTAYDPTNVFAFAQGIPIK